MSNPEEWTQDTIGKLFGGNASVREQRSEQPTEESKADSKPEPESLPIGLDNDYKETRAEYKAWYESQHPKPELTQEESIIERQREAVEAGNTTLASMLALDLKHLRLYESIFGGE